MAVLVVLMVVHLQGVVVLAAFLRLGGEGVQRRFRLRERCRST